MEEKDFVDELVTLLKSQGKTPTREAKCVLGSADVIDETHVWEVKSHRGSFKHAIGQSLAYASALARLPGVCIGSLPRPTDAEMLLAQKLRVRVMGRQDDGCLGVLKLIDQDAPPTPREMREREKAQFLTRLVDEIRTELSEKKQ